MSIKTIVDRMAVKPGEPIYIDAGLAKLVKPEAVSLPDFSTLPIAVGEPVKGAIAYVGTSPVFVGQPPKKKDA